MKRFKRLFVLVICILLMSNSFTSLVMGSENSIEPGTVSNEVSKDSGETSEIVDGGDLGEELEEDIPSSTELGDAVESESDLPSVSEESEDSATSSEDNDVTESVENPVEKNPSAVEIMESEPDSTDEGASVEEEIPASENLEMGTASPYFDVSENFPSVMSLSDYTVPGMNPTGTVINLFDYWQSTQTSADNVNVENYWNSGINKNHALKFGSGMGNSSPDSPITTDTINHWTQSSSVRMGIVDTMLDGGYPKLVDSIGGESLEYLFNPDIATEGKASYKGVGGLLQVDQEGYYYYNSRSNFAEYNPLTNNFTLYNTWAVRPGGSSPNGQFFPFNTGSQVFYDYGYGIYQNYGVSAISEIMNHYFGLTMSTRFVQVNGGHVTPGGNAITYEFSGDDDIWIFIDDVLVADLGGIHDMSSLEIDFSTGKITLNKGTWLQLETNLRDRFEAAGASTSSFKAGTNTFKDDTYHTLDFFYLERGNTDSNMSLSFNLVTIPESSLIKVDQTGEVLEGVEFSLYAADSQHSYNEEDFIATGETDNMGSFVFKGSDGGVLHLQDLYTQHQKNGVARFVLHEENLPEGYRSTGDVEFRLQELNGYVVPLSSNQWETGAYALANANISTGSLIWGIDGTGVDLDMGVGNLFAVVVRLNSSGAVDGVISGDVEEGFEVTNVTGMDGVLNAVSSESSAGHPFVVDSSGSYKTVIEELPGDIEKYELLSQGSENSEYTVKYFYTTLDSLNGVSSSNTFEVDGSEFSREFSTNIYVPNIKNYLLVKKVDEKGNPLNGVVFDIYKKEDVDVTANGVDLGDAVPVDTLETYTGEFSEGKVSFDIEGGGVFPNNSEILSEGEYFLVEKETPIGYTGFEGVIPVVVNSDGVFVDALEEGDSVSVLLGAGSLIRSMAQFTNPDLCSPYLKDIQLVGVTGTLSGNIFNWESPEWGGAIDLSYNTSGKKLSYGPREVGGSLTVSVDSGWSRSYLRSADNPDLDVSNLLSKTVTVVVENTSSSIDIEVSKVWEDDSDKDQVRPDSISVNLLRDGEVVDTAVLSPTNGWSWVWKELPEYDLIDGSKYKYSIEEVETSGYVSDISGNPEEGYIITNSKSPSLRLEKRVDGLYKNPDEKFNFRISLLNSDGSLVSGSFPVSGSISGDLKFVSGISEVSLKDGEYILLEDLPVGSSWEIIEEVEGYEKSWYVDEELVESAGGTLSHSLVPVEVVNTVIEVPDTGISGYGGSNIYVIIILVVLGCIGVYLGCRRFYGKR